MLNVGLDISFDRAGRQTGRAVEVNCAYAYMTGLPLKFS
jgi:hypothetical protein